MTAQITDTFLFNGEEYDLIGIKGGELVSPEQYGIETEMMHTACYRGFYATYELTEDDLRLRTLTVSAKGGNYPTIGGVVPEVEEGGYCAIYAGLDEVTSFTGKIRIARDFIRELYVHMGYQKPSAYKTVYDVTIKDGQVTNLNDRSADMEQCRAEFKIHYESGHSIERIEEAFSLGMD